MNNVLIFVFFMRLSMRFRMQISLYTKQYTQVLSVLAYQKMGCHFVLLPAYDRMLINFWKLSDQTRQKSKRIIHEFENMIFNLHISFNILNVNWGPAAVVSCCNISNPHLVPHSDERRKL